MLCLREAGLQPDAREVVFFGADKGMETVTHGRGTQQVEQHFGRSMAPDDAMNPEVLLCWEMNGAPLEATHGAPVRLIVPGWYGVSNVKWLDHIHVQDTRFMGRFMSRDYVTLIRPEDRRTKRSGTKRPSREFASSPMVARLTRTATAVYGLGFVLNDGTPLKSVEVRVDNGPWQAARMDTANTQFSWKLFTYDGTTSRRESTRSFPARPMRTALFNPRNPISLIKKTIWENNGQFVRKFTV